MIHRMHLFPCVDQLVGADRLASDETCKKLEDATREYGFDMAVGAKNPFY